MSSKFLATVLVGAMTLLVLAAFIWPVQTELNGAKDAKLSQDINDMSDEISAFVSENGQLPRDLGQVTFSDDLEGRVDSVEYNKIRSSTYELCGVFKTDTDETSDERDFPGEGPSILNDYSISSSYSSYYTDTHTHNKGRHCFEFAADNYYYYDDYEADSFNFDSEFDDFDYDSSEGYYDFEDLDAESLEALFDSEQPL